jgi:WD40 repeat protein
VLSHKLSADGSRVAVGGVNGSLRVYEAETGKLVSVMLGGWSAVYQALYVDAGKVIRTVHTDGVVHDFAADTGKPMREVKLDLKAATHFIALSADGKLLASSTDGGECTIWDLTAGKELAKLKGKLFGYREQVFGPGPFPLPVPGGPPQPVPPVAPPAPPGRIPPPPMGQPGPPQFVGAFSTDGKLFAAVTGQDDTITVWDTANGEEKHAVKVPNGTGSLAFSADDTHLFAGPTRREVIAPVQPNEKPAEAAFIRRYDLKTGKEVQSWKAQPAAERQGGRYSYSMAAALYPLPDKETLVVVEKQVYELWPPPPGLPGRRMRGNEYASVRLIDLAGKKADKIVQTEREAGRIGVAPDGKRLWFVTTVTHQQGGVPKAVVQVVDTTTGMLAEAELREVRWTGAGATVAFHPDGNSFIVGTGDGLLSVWDVAKLKERKPEPKPDGKQ